MQKKIMSEKTRLRFAPSPTGPLHIGGLRTALFNYLYAKKTNGELVLRVEDTDLARKVDKSQEHIEQSLAWVGINFDESSSKGVHLLHISVFPLPFNSQLHTEQLLGLLFFVFCLYSLYKSSKLYFFI